MLESNIIELSKLSLQFKALGDNTRLQILALLAEQQRCVCDIQVNIKIPANLLSHHLKVLRKAGLINASKRGRWIDYSLNGPAIEHLKSMLPPSTQLAGIDEALFCASASVVA